MQPYARRAQERDGRFPLNQPLVHSLSLVNAGDFTNRLGENSRAVLFGYGLNTTPDQMAVTIEGLPIDVLFPLTLTDLDKGLLLSDRIYLHIPESLQPTPAKPFMNMAVTIDGVTSHARIPVIDGNAPSLYIYDYLEAEDRNFLDDAVAFAHDSAGNLNFAAQPARPGGTVTLYAAGVSASAVPGDLTATIDDLPATVLDVGTDPLGQAGVVTVTLHVPAGVRAGTNVPVTIEANGIISNRAVIAVFTEAEVPNPTDPLAASTGRVWITSLAPLPALTSSNRLAVRSLAKTARRIRSTSC